MTKYKRHIPLLLVLTVAFILRFWQLSSLPPALDWDETSTVYNAYSVLRTGKDEFGKSFPLLFRAYDGHVPPLLIYLNVLSVGIFGLSEFAARFPNAFLGVLTIVGIYLVSVQIFKNRNIALLSALFLAISPWHVTYSRVNFFASLPIFFLVFGSYFFLKGLTRKPYLIIALSFFELAILSYFTSYVFVPMFVLSLVILYWDKLKFRTAFLFLTPIILSAFLILLTVGGGQTRFKGVSAFWDPDILKESSNYAALEKLEGKIVHNRRLIYAQKFLENYFANYRFDFLFGKADLVERMVVPGASFGLLFVWDLPFLLLGIYLLIRKKAGWIFLLWLLLAPVASAATLPQMVSTRITLMVPALSAVCAYGFWTFCRLRPKIIKIFLIILLGLNFFVFSHNYFYHFAREKSKQWLWGYKEVFEFLNSEGNYSRNVYFVFKQPDILDQVYIFNLFYNKVEPTLWQQNGGTKLGCIGTTGQYSFGRFNFVPYTCLSKPINWDLFGKNDLIVTSRNFGEKPYWVNYFLDGKEAFYIFEFPEISDRLKKAVENKEI